VEAEEKFSFFKMASNIERNIESATVLLRPAVESCIRELDEKSGPDQQKVSDSMLYSDY